MIIENSTANFLREFIHNHRITQTEFARKIGVSQGLIGQWLRGERPISVAKSLDIERTFKIDAGLLNNDVLLVRNNKRMRVIK
jgi:transcriptional regulator with XRE-family HTH domain